MNSPATALESITVPPPAATRQEPVTVLIEVRGDWRVHRETATSRPETGEEQKSTLPIAGASPERLYPHAFDRAASSGRALAGIEAALTAAEAALAAWSDNAFEDVSSRLAEVGVALRAATSDVVGNEALAGLLDYTRRAVIGADAAALSRAELNGLVSVLRSLAANPVVNLAGAAEYADALLEASWDGSSAHVAALVDALLEDDETDLATSAAGQPVVAT